MISLRLERTENCLLDLTTSFFEKITKRGKKVFEFFSGKQKYSIGNMWVGETMRKDKIEPTLTFSCSTISVYLLKIRVGTVKDKVL